MARLTSIHWTRASESPSRYARRLSEGGGRWLAALMLLAAVALPLSWPGTGHAQGGTFPADALQKLLAADGAAFDGFGASVALSGDRAIVGAPYDNDNDNDSGNFSGSAYVFERAAGGGWREVAKLFAADGAARDEFGWSVALSGDRAIVGAYRDDDNGFFSGSAYVFERAAGGGWSEVAKLVAADGAARDRFGDSVAISGDRAIVGAFGDNDNGFLSGSAYVFERAAGGGWNEVAKLIAADGAARDFFGSSVALSGDRAIVGAVGDDDNGLDSGSAYVFERAAGGGWGEVAKLIAAGGDRFGTSVALSGDRAIVGASGDDDNGVNSGSAYVFERAAGGGWNEVSKLIATDGAARDLFGFSVAISGDRAIVGASGDDDNGFLSGSAYVFERAAGGGWSEVTKLIAADGAARDRFGISVALSVDRAIVGALRDDDNGFESGSAYVFDLAAPVCNGLPVTVDLNRGGTPTRGDDVILGTPAGDTINAMGGNDTVCGMGGADVIHAGGGDDWVAGGPGDDIIRGGAGDDELRGQAGDDAIMGNPGADRILGGAGVDEIDGGAGNDILLPGPGATAGSGFLVKGGGGDDIVYGGPDADDIRGNAGDDRLFGRGGADRINGGPDDDWINGDSGDDVLNGGKGDDVVLGGAGDDVVRGDLGDDAVLGGEGKDSVEGGGGDDVLVGGASPGDVCRGQGGVDVATSSCERTFGVP